jgi:hypothetical protein
MGVSAGPLAGRVSEANNGSERAQPLFVGCVVRGWEFLPGRHSLI